jgi:ABC-2 type transport system ATP-binding protein
MTAPASDSPALAVEAVSHAFGDRKALSDVSLTVPRGRFTVLLGLNGAGKTTLFSLVTRLYGNVTGAIRVCGFDVRRMPRPALARLGVVFQSRAIDSDLTVMENLVYHAALHGIGGRAARARAIQMLERTGLADRAGDRARTLSGGQLRRVEIVRAMLHGPELLLLDEPTVGLDVGARQAILTAVRTLVAEDGLGVLWATHLMDEVEPDDRVVVLHKGVVLAEDSAAAIIARTGAADVRGAFVALTGERPVADREAAA